MRENGAPLRGSLPINPTFEPRAVRIRIRNVRVRLTNVFFLAANSTFVSRLCKRPIEQRREAINVLAIFPSALKAALASVPFH